ncbi:MAG: protein-L-isoaspartate(D-aspartate) O-methyltransferase [Robiginitalea sp.]
MRFILFIFLLAFGMQGAAGQLSYRQQREKMVAEQLQARDIYKSSVLEAMAEVPRHVFVPEDYRPWAYRDQALPIGEGQTISQPYIVAYMTQALRLRPEDRVLEIGTGSGYQAAILSLLTRQVYTIEIVESLGLAARERLKSLGYDNIAVHVGDGYNGWPSQAPFDAIMVTAGAEQLPQPLMDQLAEDGRMIIPIGPNGGVRQLTLVTKKKGKYKFEKLMPVRFVPFVRKTKDQDR